MARRLLMQSGMPYNDLFTGEEILTTSPFDQVEEAPAQDGDAASASRYDDLLGGTEPAAAVTETPSHYNDLLNGATSEVSEASSDDLFSELVLPVAEPATLPLRSEYRGEDRDASFFRGDAGRLSPLAEYPTNMVGPLPEGAERTRFTNVRTRYFDAREQMDRAVQIQGGLLTDGNDRPLDTSGATGRGTADGDKGKHIFALTPGGTMRAADPWAHHREVRLPGQADENGVASAALELVNHSSLVAGGDVAGAGDLRVEQGKLQSVSDQSGHYQPNHTMLRNVLDHFADGGVDMHDVAVKMINKTPFGRPMMASAREVMQGKGEDAIRSQRSVMRDQIEEAASARPRWKDSMDARRGRGPKVGRVRHEDAKWNPGAARGQGRVGAMTALFNHFSQ